MEKTKEELEKDLNIENLKNQLEREKSFKDIEKLSMVRDNNSIIIDKVECARRNVELLMKLAGCDPMAKFITSAEISKQIKSNLKTMELIN